MSLKMDTIKNILDTVVKDEINGENRDVQSTASKGNLQIYSRIYYCRGIRHVEAIKCTIITTKARYKTF